MGKTSKIALKNTFALLGWGWFPVLLSFIGFCLLAIFKGGDMVTEQLSNWIYFCFLPGILLFSHIFAYFYGKTKTDGQIEVTHRNLTEKQKQKLTDSFKRHAAQIQYIRGYTVMDSEAEIYCNQIIQCAYDAFINVQNNMIGMRPFNYIPNNSPFRGIHVITKNANAPTEREKALRIALEEGGLDVGYVTRDDAMPFSFVVGSK